MTKDGTNREYAARREFYTRQLHERFADDEDTWVDQLLEHTYLVAETVNEEILHDRIENLKWFCSDWLVDLDTR